MLKAALKMKEEIHSGVLGRGKLWKQDSYNFQSSCLYVGTTEDKDLRKLKWLQKLHTMETTYVWED